MEDKLSDGELERFGEFVARAMGLDFPPPRWPDLQRGITVAASELGFDSAASCARWFMCNPPSKPQLETLASQLTVGETYFFRDNRVFEILADQILPPLIAARRNNDRRLRIWSAACCTGEEAYSIAIVLRNLLPDISDWNITILATDINSRFLQKAEQGQFGEWSFRNTPDWLKRKHFRALPNGRFEILPQIKAMVHFAYLNLVEDVYPSLLNDTNAMDVIFCRNVLMYFTAPNAIKAIEKLYRAQMDGGWLIVSPSELPHVSPTSYATVNFKDAILYQKERGKSWSAEPRLKELPVAACVEPEPILFPSSHTPDSYVQASELYERGKYVEATEKLKDVISAEPADTSAFPLLARSLANEGKLAEALECCQKWIAADKLSAPARYLHGIVLQEQGEIDQAVVSLRGALYLDPRFVLPHFVLGSIARNRGRDVQARVHLSRALAILSEYDPGDTVPESDGVTADRFIEIITSLIHEEALT